MIAAAWYDPILDGLGTVLAFLYNLVPDYGVTIILFTLGIRLLLFPLFYKQVRSQQAMQALQPKLRQIQQKYKGNRQKISEETMALYREHGVNPLGGCLPVLAQLPVLIALFAVLRMPGGLTRLPGGETVTAGDDSRLTQAIIEQDTGFLGTNLLCSATQAGKQVEVPTGGIPTAPDTLNCGTGFPVHIPYYAFALLMIGTTYYQQRQMLKSSPTVNPQQQTIMRVMPLLFGFWGFLFPAGLVVYWSTTNLVQIGLQAVLLKRGHIGPEAQAKIVSGDGRARPTKPRATSPKTAAGGTQRKQSPTGGSSARPRTGRPRPGSSSRSTAGQTPPTTGSSPRKVTGGGTGAQDGTGGASRKKRRKR
jgi:YidC/Oxa1 family membrane protein insertase